MRRMMKILSSGLLLGLCIFGSAPAQAGYYDDGEVRCARNSGGTTWCSGTIRAYRTHAHNNTRALFYINHSGSVTFSAYIGTASYHCSFDTTQYTATFGTVAGQSLNQYFAVAINEEGRCTYGYVHQGSSYTPL